MLIIRLQRVGRKNQPAFRIVLAEKQRAVKKQVNEILGHYNPRSKEFVVKDPERVKHWISQHVQVSPTVHNLLITKGLLTGEKVKAWKPKKKKEEKAQTSAEAGTGPSTASASVVETKPETQAATETPPPSPTGAEVASA